MTDTTMIERRRFTYIVLDLESAVLDESGHKRYQQMERYARTDDQRSRRGYKRHEDPLKTPRWPFQTITTASVMVLKSHVDGNLDVAEFETFSAPEQSEKQVIAGVLKMLANEPAAELVTWAGMMHDIPVLTLAAMRYGLTLPQGWKWLAFGGNEPVRHLDFARTTTGGFKMKPVHMSEVLAALGIPAKLTIPAFAVARHIYAGRWEAVQEACECDVISTALLLAHWRRLHDAGVPVGAAVDRILRRVIKKRAGRSYIPELNARRAAWFEAMLASAANDAPVFAPWLDSDAA